MLPQCVDDKLVDPGRVGRQARDGQAVGGGHLHAHQHESHFSKQSICRFPPSFPDSGVLDLPQSSSSPFQEHETVHRPPQVGDEARLLVLSGGAGSRPEGRAGGREGDG